MNCIGSIILILVVAIITFVVVTVARIKRDGIGSSNEVIHGLPPEMGFKYKNDCNDDNSWTGE